MLSWKNIFKSWVGVPVLILIALMVVWLLPGYKSWQIKRAYDKVEEPYYTDTYGGATPEETYDLFINALKDGDIELASKYFVIESQDNWLKTLQEYEKEGIILGFVEELENTKKTWKKSDKSDEKIISFTYEVLIKVGSKATIDSQEVEIPAGNYTNETMFVKYPSGVWKIELL
ncbi:MAG: hypothetical protein AAB461_01060 [Patescibacteria group bacterium]|mgnify:CR=1 FL=1